MPLGGNLPTRLPESSGTLYYVGGAGASDANAGTNPSLPWATFNKALQTLNGNERCVVRPGTYSEGALTCTRGGSPGNVITIEAEGTPPVIQGSVVLQGVNAAYWRFRNIVFDADAAHTSAFKLTYSGADPSLSNIAAHHVEFYGCEAKNAAGAGAGWLVSGSSLHEIQWWNCLSHTNDQSLTTTHGWYLNGGSQLHLVNCIARDNGGYGFHCYNGAGSQSLTGLRFYNCVSDANVLRSGWLIQSDATQSEAEADPAVLVQDVQIYNSIASNHQNASTAFGYRVRYANVTNIILVVGFVPHTIDSSFAYNNLSGATSVTPSSGAVTITNLQTDNPLYTNQSNNDFHLQTGSPAIGFGLEAYTPTFDFEGTTRHDPDAGAYAYTADDPVAEPAMAGSLGSRAAKSYPQFIKFKGVR